MAIGERKTLGSFINIDSNCSNNFVVDSDGRDWVVITETGRVEWRDDINSQSELPDDYLYVGDSNEDILSHYMTSHPHHMRFP